MGIRITQEVVEVLSTYNPRVRVTQENIEVLATFSARVRITQEVVEVLRTTTDAPLVTTSPAISICWK